MASLADLQVAAGQPNVPAFLRMLRAGESNQTDNAYRMTYGGQLFDAPPWAHPHRLITAGGVTSSAAGAYGFIMKTWDGVAAQFGFADFSPHNQDLGAIALIAEQSALADVIVGRLEAAIQKCLPEWASLPGANPRRTLDQARAVYRQYGGIEVTWA